MLVQKFTYVADGEGAVVVATHERERGRTAQSVVNSDADDVSSGCGAFLDGRVEGLVGEADVRSHLRSHHNLDNT